MQILLNKYFFATRKRQLKSEILMMEKLYYKSSFLPSAKFNRCVLCLHSSSNSSIMSSLSSSLPNIPKEFSALRG